MGICSNIQIVAIRDIFGKKNINSIFSTEYDPSRDDVYDLDKFLNEIYSMIGDYPDDNIVRETLMMNIQRLKDRRIYLKIINDHCK